MRGAPAVAQQEYDREQIHQTAKEAPATELRVTEASGVVLDRNFPDAKALPMREHGHEAMQLTVQAHVLEHRVAVGFETAIHVVQFYARDRAHEPIENARRQ